MRKTSSRKVVKEEKERSGKARDCYVLPKAKSQKFRYATWKIAQITHVILLCFHCSGISLFSGTVFREAGFYISQLLTTTPLVDQLCEINEKKPRVLLDRLRVNKKWRRFNEIQAETTKRAGKETTTPLPRNRVLASP